MDDLREGVKCIFRIFGSKLIIRSMLNSILNEMISKPFLTELREVDVTVPDDVVGQVDDLLLHGVEAQHLHGGEEILGVDGGLPEPGLIAPEDGGDDVQLLFRQVVPLLQHLPGDEFY